MKSILFTLRLALWCLAWLPLALMAQTPPANAPLQPGTRPAFTPPNGMPLQGPPARIINIDMQMQADAAHYQAWPGGGVTVRRGVGVIEPWGSGDYFCGRDYPETQSFAVSEALKQVVRDLGGTGGVMCIYRLADGDLITYDITAGPLAPITDGFRVEIINVVLGGTGKFRGATGMWLGKAIARGEMREVGKEVRVPDVLLKLMTGYVRLPESAP